MRVFLIGLVLMIGAAGFLGCEKARAPIVFPEVTATEAELAELPETHRALVGTTWVVGDFQARFLDGDTVFIAGTPLAEIAPAGMEAPYTIADGVIEVSAAGETKAGTWDGETLMMDGVVAEKK